MALLTMTVEGKTTIGSELGYTCGGPVPLLARKPGSQAYASKKPLHRRTALLRR